jgi:cytochrome P450
MNDASSTAPKAQPPQADFASNPHPLLETLLQTQRVLRSGPNAYTLLRYRDIDAALRNRKLGAGIDILLRSVSRAAGLADDKGPFIEMMERSLQNKNPPDHTRLRSIVSSAFTPAAVAALAGRAETIAHELLDQVRPGEVVDLAEGFAGRLPLLVIAEMLGIPDVDQDSVLGWSRELGRGFGATSKDDIDAANDAQHSFTEYSKQLIAEHRSERRDNLLSALIAAEQEGNRLSTDELLDFVGGLLFAGHETTKNLIGNGFHLLMKYPEQQAILRRQPELIPRAVEEMLRYEPPAGGAMRIALEQTEVAGITVNPGDSVMCLTLAGNRDPEKFTDPQRFDVTRNEGAPLTFGSGVHYCLGAQLARMEAATAVRTLFERFGRMEPVSTDLRWKRGGLRGLESLPARFYV